MLLVATAESLVKHLFLVGPSVAGGVAQEPDVGWRHHQHAVAPRQHRIGGFESVRKKSAFVVAAIPVGVGESNDSRSGLALVIDAHRIIGHFSHPHPPVRSPCDVDRVHDERLGRHELDAESGARLHGSQRHLSGARSGYLFAHQISKAALVDVERQPSAGVLGLPIKAPSLDPCAVVAAVGAHNRRNHAAFSGVVFADASVLATADQAAPRPTHVHRFEHPCAVVFGVRKDHVVESVIIDIRETQARVAAFRRHDRRSFWQSEGQFLPAAPGVRVLASTINRRL